MFFRLLVARLLVSRFFGLSIASFRYQVHNNILLYSITICNVIYYILTNHNNNIVLSPNNELRSTFRGPSLSESHFKIDYNIPYF